MGYLGVLSTSDLCTPHLSLSRIFSIVGRWYCDTFLECLFAGLGISFKMYYYFLGVLLKKIRQKVVYLYSK